MSASSLIDRESITFAYKKAPPIETSSSGEAEGRKMILTSTRGACLLEKLKWGNCGL